MAQATKNTQTPENGFESNPRYDAYMRYCDGCGCRASLREFVSWVSFYADQFRRNKNINSYAPIGEMEEFTEYLHAMADCAWPRDASERTEKILRAVSHYRIGQYVFADKDAKRTPESWACLMSKQLGEFADAVTFNNRNARRHRALALAALCVAYVENEEAETEAKDLGYGVAIDGVLSDLQKATGNTTKGGANGEG